jgi:hypothetical protein
MCDKGDGGFYPVERVRNAAFRVSGSASRSQVIYWAFVNRDGEYLCRYDSCGIDCRRLRFY